MDKHQEYVKKPLPFESYIYQALAMYLSNLPISMTRNFTDQWNQNPLVQDSHQWDKRYLGFLRVREDNWYLVQGTGFEGYFTLQSTPNPEWVLEKLLALGSNIRIKEKRLARFSPVTWERLFRVLTSQKHPTLHELERLSIILGAEMALLRSNLLLDSVAQGFRETTNQLTLPLPDITYLQDPQGVMLQHVYRLPQPLSNGHKKLAVNISNLRNDEQREAWLIVSNLGKVGHPLVRKLLKEYSQ